MHKIIYIVSIVSIGLAVASMVYNPLVSCVVGLFLFENFLLLGGGIIQYTKTDKEVELVVNSVPIDVDESVLLYATPEEKEEYLSCAQELTELHNIHKERVILRERRRLERGEKDLQTV